MHVFQGDGMGGGCHTLNCNIVSPYACTSVSLMVSFVTVWDFVQYVLAIKPDSFDIKHLISLLFLPASNPVIPEEYFPPKHLANQENYFTQILIQLEAYKLKTI